MANLFVIFLVCAMNINMICRAAELPKQAVKDLKGLKTPEELIKMKPMLAMNFRQEASQPAGSQCIQVPGAHGCDDLGNQNTCDKVDCTFTPKSAKYEWCHPWFGCEEYDVEVYQGLFKQYVNSEKCKYENERCNGGFLCTQICRTNKNTYNMENLWIVVQTHPKIKLAELSVRVPNHQCKCGDLFA